MNKNNQIEQLRKWEQKILKGMEKISKCTGVHVTFREINVNDETYSHDFDAPGDIYKTFQKIQEAVLQEYQLDLNDVRSQIKRLEEENDTGK